jgi:hypothetical protein
MSTPAPPLGYAIDTQPAFLQPTVAQTKFVAAPANGKAVAEVDADSPNTIKVREPGKFTPGIQTHEETHVFQRSRKTDDPGLIDTVMNYLRPTPAPKAGYDYGGIEGLEQARAQGKTIANYGPEAQAEIVRNFQEQTQQAIKSGDTNLLDRVNAAYAPFVRQLAALPAKDDTSNTIDTKPAAPGLPPSSVTGIMKPDALLGGQARIVAPQGYKLDNLLPKKSELEKLRAQQRASQ